jgi:hypothetical protein
MTTKKILLAAGSAALWANFAFAQDPQPQPPQPDPSAPVQAQPAVPAPDPQQAPPPPQWRRFGQQADNGAPNNTPPVYGDPQQGPPPNYPGNRPPNYGPQQGPNYGPQQGPNYGPQGQGQGAPNYRAYPPMAMAPANMTLPAGTWIKVHIDRVLSTNHSKVGDVFSGTLAQPLIVNGFVVGRRGQNITGHVTAVAKAGRVKGTSEISLEINEIALADGQQIPIKTQLVEYHGQSTRGNDAFAIGGTTLLGAAIGGAVNGGVGAGVGAAAGLVASTVGVLVTRGRPTVIFPEALLTFKTSEPVPFTTQNSTYSFQPAQPQDYSPAMPSRTLVGRPGYAPYGYYGGPYAYGYPYGYGYGYPFYGGLYIGGRFGRRW